MTLRLVSFLKESLFETKFLPYFKSSTSCGKSYFKNQPNILTQIEMFLTMSLNLRKSEFAENLESTEKLLTLSLILMFSCSLPFLDDLNFFENV